MYKNNPNRMPFWCQKSASRVNSESMGLDMIPNL